MPSYRKQSAPQSYSDRYKAGEYGFPGTHHLQQDPTTGASYPSIMDIHSRGGGAPFMSHFMTPGIQEAADVNRAAADRVQLGYLFKQMLANTLFGVMPQPGGGFQRTEGDPNSPQPNNFLAQLLAMSQRRGPFGF